MTNVRESFKCLIVRFSREDQGGITIMGLLLLISMLVVGGMAVDFMMFEARRATLQGVADRSVLAAAKLGQDLDTEAKIKAHSTAVVMDYFAIAGQTDNMRGAPEVTVEGGRRSVEVMTDLGVSTNYLRLIGIDRLDTEVMSAAVEADSNIEISLVLDTSGSMGSGAGENSTRMQLLKEAATDFVNTLLTPEEVVPTFKDQISISLVSYSSQVSIGDDIYQAINATNPQIEDDTGLFSNPARCVEIPTTEYGNSAWNTSHQFRQIEHFGMFGGESQVDGAPDGTTVIDTPTCPTAPGNHIIPLSQNAATLTGAINKLEPYLNTSIHQGMKWGLTLVDPSFRPILNRIDSIDDAFQGSRPTDYPERVNVLDDEGTVIGTTPGQAIDTVKYVILMTDGQNWTNYRLASELYDTAAERLYWASKSRNYFNRNSDDRAGMTVTRNSDVYDIEYYSDAPTNPPSGTRRERVYKDSLLQASCNAAKDAGVVVYSIMMAEMTGEAVYDAEGNQVFPNQFKQMRDCASSVENHYFETSAEEVQNAFKAIADNITDLRLNQ